MITFVVIVIALIAGYFVTRPLRKEFRRQQFLANPPARDLPPISSTPNSRGGVLHADVMRDAESIYGHDGSDWNEDSKSDTAFGGGAPLIAKQLQSRAIQSAIAARSAAGLPIYADD